MNFTEVEKLLCLIGELKFYRVSARTAQAIQDLEEAALELLNAVGKDLMNADQLFPPLAEGEMSYKE